MSVTVSRGYLWRLLVRVRSVQVLRSGVQVVTSTGGGGNSLLGCPPIVIPHGPKTPPNLVILNSICLAIPILYTIHKYLPHCSCKMGRERYQEDLYNNNNI